MRLPTLVTILLLASAGAASGQDRHWVFLNEKPGDECRLPSSKACLLSPVDSTVVASIASTGAQIRSVSRWLNAVSVTAEADAILKLGQLEGVASVRGVQRLTIRRGIEEEFAPKAPRHEAPMLTLMNDSTYGRALEHTKFHNIDLVHDLGFFGDGVKMGVIDGGFDMNHPVFAHLKESGRLIGERDFVDGGDDAKANVETYSYHNHGTSVASLIAGRIEGEYFGVAPGVSLAVARTEDDSQEASVEEDNWVEAIEWLQTLGVRVVNSSLGYTTFTTNPQDSYTYADMNGRTAVISRAAIMAANVFNMVIVTSAGNDGNNSWRYISAPADADSILAVGSVTAAGSRATSSSVGPTADGRIKPDVGARGDCVSTAVSPTVSRSDTTLYSACRSGTSFASPIVAGIVALAMEARPGMDSYWYVQKVKEASSQYRNPDNFLGYGIVDAFKLVQSLNMGTAVESERTASPDRFFLTSNYPNPFNPSTTLTYQAQDGWGLESVRVVDVTGRVVQEWVPSTPSSAGSWAWDGTTSLGMKASSGVYVALFRFSKGAERMVKPHTMSLIK